MDDDVVEVDDDVVEVDEVVAEKALIENYCDKDWKTYLPPAFLKAI